MTAILFCVALLAGLLAFASALIMIERWGLALWQDRLGPNRAGPLGLLQLPADMIKLFFKEDWLPPFADRPLFVLAPMIPATAALLSFSVIVWAPPLRTVADLNIGVLFVLAMSSLSVYGPALGGWSSRNKYALLGALRAAAQMLGYEAPLALAMLGVVVLAGSFRVADIVEAQRGLWFVVPQLPGFVLFFLAALAETRRLPFDLPEAENELVAGFHTEYSSMKFALFFLGEYVGILLMSALTVTLYFGGYLGPFIDRWPGLGAAWFVLKMLAFVALFILLRASLPRPRYDQLNTLAWKLLLPLALANLLATGAAVLGRQAVGCRL